MEGFISALVKITKRGKKRYKKRKRMTNHEEIWVSSTLRLLIKFGRNHRMTTKMTIKMRKRRQIRKINQVSWVRGIAYLDKRMMRGDAKTMRRRWWTGTITTKGQMTIASGAEVLGCLRVVVMMVNVWEHAKVSALVNAMPQLHLNCAQFPLFGRVRPLDKGYIVSLLFSPFAAKFSQ